MLYMDAIAVLAFFWVPVGLIGLLIWGLFFEDPIGRRRRRSRRERDRADKRRKREHEARMAADRARLNERRW
jgi:hypothetical protein